MKSWQEIKISDFLKERKNRYKPHETSSLGLQRVEKIDFKGIIYLSDKPTKTNMILVKNGDLLISGINVEKGAISVYQGEEDILATIHYSSYQFDKSVIDINYFKLFLGSKSFKDLLIENAGNGIKNELKAKHLLPLKILLPEIKIQREIIKIISSRKEKIVMLNSEIQLQHNNITKMRQAILQEAVQGKLVPQDSNDEPASELLKKIKAEKDKLIREGKIKKEKPILTINQEEIPYELPKGWEWCRLSELINNLKYGTSKLSEYKVHKNPILRIPNIKNGNIDISDLKYTDLSSVEERELKLEIDDMLVIRSNGSKSLVGRCAIVDKESKGFAYAGYLIRLRYNLNFVISKYIYLVFESVFIRNLIELPIRTTSGVKNINSKEISNLIIPLPPYNEQKRIVEKVDKLMKLCDELELKVKESQKNADLLMQAVLQESFENN